MNKFVLIAIAVILAAAGWYAFSPDGPIGYDEGARLAIYTGHAAEKLQHSSDSSSTLTYTPKYGNDQAISVEITQSQACANRAPDCSSTVVVARVAKGKSGAGYALGNSAVVPRRLELNKAQGPVQLDLRKQDGVVQVVGLR